MNKKLLIGGGLAVAAVAAFAFMRRGGVGSVRNDAAGPRLPAMPAMPAMPSMPGMPTMPKMGNMPNAPQMAGSGFDQGSLFRGMWG